MKTPRRIVAEFEDNEELVQGLRLLRRAGYSRLETYTPFPTDEVDELVPGKGTRIGWMMFAGGLLGGSGAYFMEWYGAHNFPYRVGGRPLTSWPAFIPITFELTVLSAALTGLVAFLLLCGLPRLDNPLFQVPHFERASQDRFFVAVFVDDEACAPEALLMGCGALLVTEVNG